MFKLIKVYIFFVTCSTFILAEFSNIKTSIYKGLANDADTAPFTKIGNNYYFIEAHRKANWFDAAHRCRTYNAQLASIETVAEMEDISNYLKANNYKDDDYFWLSGNDLGKEGEFYWLGTGYPITYAKWSKGQPDNAGGNEDCVHLWKKDHGDFYMNDANCESDKYYICEANPKTIAITVY